jgi:hypothetical protein
MSDLKDILSNSNKDIDNQRLMDYLSGKLNNAEQHELEAGMEDEMLNDALEGLQQVQNKKDLDLAIYQMNQQLKSKLAIKEKKLKRRKIQNFELTVITIVIILALCVLAYVLVRMSKHP